MSNSFPLAAVQVPTSFHSLVLVKSAVCEDQDLGGFSLTASLVISPHVSGDKSLASFILRCMCSEPPVSTSSASLFGIKNKLKNKNANAKIVLNSFLLTTNHYDKLLNNFR